MTSLYIRSHAEGAKNRRQHRLRFKVCVSQSSDVPMSRNFPASVQIKRRVIEMFLRWKQEQRAEKRRRCEERTELYVVIPNGGHWTEYSPID